MNTPTPPDPRTLAHRLTTVGHALHHRLFTHLHDSGIHPKTLLLLGAVDGRIDAPWVVDRLARGGKRVAALADRGWIVRTDDGWSLTDEGRTVLDRVDAERAAILAEAPAEHLTNLTAALDSLATTLGIDGVDAGGAPGPGPRGGYRVEIGAGRRGFGRDPRRAFGPNEHHGFRVGERPSARSDRPLDATETAGTPETPAASAAGDGGGHHHDPGHGDGHGHQDHDERGHGHERGRGEHGHGGLGGHTRGAHGRGGGWRACGGDPRQRRRRGEERAFERGFEAGFQRGRAAGDSPSDPRA